MVSLAIEVQDMAHVQSLMVVPSPRRVPTAREMAAFVARLAPIEMAAPSISCSSNMANNNNINKLVPRGQHACSDDSYSHGNNNSGSNSSANPKPFSLPGWTIPLGYLCCGTVLFLWGLVLVPGGLTACAHILTPLWTLTLAAHALALNDPTWSWLGLLVACLLPFVLLLRDPLFAGFYLLLVAVFGTGGRFWIALKGPPLVLVTACWFGFASCCVLAVLADHAGSQLAAAACFSLASAVVASSTVFGKLVLRVRLDSGPS